MAQELRVRIPQMDTHGKGRHTYSCVCKFFAFYYSITVQRNCIKFDVNIAPDIGSLSLSLWHCSSFSFVTGIVLVSRFETSFKCTADRILQTLITPHTKVLCS